MLRGGVSPKHGGVAIVARDVGTLAALASERHRGKPQGVDRSSSPLAF